MAKKKKKESAEDIAKKHNILTEDQMKDLKGPYIAKDNEEWHKVRKKQLELRNSDTYKSKSFVIPNDAVINVPISGMFKNAIQDTLNFCMSRMTKEETLRSMLNIQTNFEKIKDPKLIKPHDKALWSLMSLLTEINFQAQEQGKLLNTDESIGDKVTEFMENLESDPSYKVTSEEINNITKDYKNVVPGATDFTTDNTTED